jgi:hypothetical protein
VPELLTKHPEVTITVLESAGARCGGEQPRAILKDCPAERFCKLPGGEVCLYGVDEVGAMTQITRGELATQVCPEQKASGASGCHVAPRSDALPGVVLGVFALALVRRVRRAP